MSKPVWVAGFAHHRAATKIHDDLKAVAAVIDDGSIVIGIVALDAIGFFHDEVLACAAACRRGAPRLCDRRLHAQSFGAGPDGHLGTERLPLGQRPRVPSRRRGWRGCGADGRGERAGAGSSLVRRVPLDAGAWWRTRAIRRCSTPPYGCMHFTAPNGSTIGHDRQTGLTIRDGPWPPNTELTADFPG
jgi:hypothetical protein